MTDEEVLKGIAHDIAKEYASKVAIAKGFEVNLLASAYFEAYQTVLAQLRDLLPPEPVQSDQKRS